MDKVTSHDAFKFWKFNALNEITCSLRGLYTFTGETEDEITRAINTNFQEVFNHTAIGFWICFFIHISKYAGDQQILNRV